MKNQKSKLVLWAVDPFEVEHFNAQAEAVRALDHLIDPDTVIQPVFVWGGRPLGKTTQASQIARQADLLLGKWPRPELEHRTRSLKVIVAGGTTSAQAKALADYAKRVRCEMILTSHHIRSPLKRALMGSFSESLSLVAQVPLLIVPPTRPYRSRRKEILFTADFSEASKAAFEEILRLAIVSNSKLRIFHKIEALASYAVEFGYAYSPEIYEAEVSDAAKSLEEMRERAKKVGVAAETILDKAAGQIGQSIVTEAKKGYDLVAMAAHKGFWDRVLLGSASRYVLRECPTAVFIFRPTAKDLAKKTRHGRKSLSKASSAAASYLV